MLKSPLTYEPQGGGEVGWLTRWRSQLPTDSICQADLARQFHPVAIPRALPPAVRWSGSPVKLDLPAPATDSKVDYKNGQTLITPEHSVYPHCFPRAHYPPSAHDPPSPFTSVSPSIFTRVYFSLRNSS